MCDAALPGEYSKACKGPLSQAAKFFVAAYARRHDLFEKLCNMEDIEGSYHVISQAIDKHGPSYSLKRMALMTLFKNLLVSKQNQYVDSLTYFLCELEASVSPQNLDGSLDEDFCRMHRRITKFNLDIQPRLSSLIAAATVYRNKWARNDFQKWQPRILKFAKKTYEITSAYVKEFGVPNFGRIKVLGPMITFSCLPETAIHMLADFPLLNQDAALPFIAAPAGEYFYCVWLLALLMPFFNMRFDTSEYDQYDYPFETIHFQSTIRSPHRYFF